MSTVLDAGQAATSDKIFVPKADLPLGVKLVVEIRTGNTPTPDPTWSAWSAVGNGGAIPGPKARYLQYSVSLTIRPGIPLKLPIPFEIDITSVANKKVYQHSKTNQGVSSSVPVVAAGVPVLSSIIDLGQAKSLKAVSWTAPLPSGATLVVEVTPAIRGSPTGLGRRGRRSATAGKSSNRPHATCDTA